MNKSASEQTLTESYTQDILEADFEQMIFAQDADYEGKVICTLIRKKAPNHSKKAMLYVHGFNDYFFQTELAEKVIENGYDFYAIDLRKYGRSYLEHQKFNNVRSLDEYYPDLDKALQQIKSEGHTIVLLGGHSQGGLLVSVYASDHPDSRLFQALYMNSPFYEFHLNFMLRTIGIPIVSALGKKFPDKIIQGGFSPLYGLSLHKDEKGEWDYSLEYKPHVSPPVNFGYIRAIHLAQKRIKNSLKINVPALVMHSDKTIYEKEWSDKMFTGDVILDVAQIHKYAEKIYGDISIQTVEGGMHDLVLSPKPVREKVYKHLFEWMKKV